MRRAGDAGPPVWLTRRYLPWTVNSITSMNSGSPWFDSMVNRTKRTLALPVFGANVFSLPLFLAPAR